MITLFVNRIDGEIGLSSDSWPLPKGLSLARGIPLRNGMVTAQIVGIPEPGQGGRYDLIFMWTNGVDHVNSTFRLDVLETASITSPASFTFFEGMPASGQVTTQGYPVNPIGVDCVGNICTDMTISLQGVPRQLNGLTLTDHSLIGFPTGVGQFGGMISGSAGSTRPLSSQRTGTWAYFSAAGYARGYGNRRSQRRRRGRLPGSDCDQQRGRDIATQAGTRVRRQRRRRGGPEGPRRDGARGFQSLHLRHSVDRPTNPEATSPPTGEALCYLVQ